MKFVRFFRPVLLSAMLLAAGADLLPAQSKVAIVGLQKALQETAEIKAAEADLKARFGPRQEELAGLEKEIAKLQQDLEQNQTKYNEATLQEMSSRLQLRQRQYQRNAQSLQDDVNGVRQDILNRVGQRLQEVIKKVAEEKGLDLVVDAGNTYFFKPAMDITPDVTKAYDLAYPAKK
jgi:outer membrane protein